MIKRVYVEKKSEFRVEAQELFHDLKENLGIQSLEGVRILARYDVEGLDEEQFARACRRVFSEPQVDDIYEEEIDFEDNATVFAIEYLPGQYDQRADSAAQCIQILTHKARPTITTARVIVLKGSLSEEEIETIKTYTINAVDSREASMEKPKTLTPKIDEPEDVPYLHNFIEADQKELSGIIDELGLAMSQADIEFCQSYYRNEEKRNPSLTEIKLLDTYWSDHCRHTTFSAKLESVEIEDSPLGERIKEIYEFYKHKREEVYGNRINQKPICLMDIAVMGMKALRKEGKLENLEESEEINACSIIVPIIIDGKEEEWLVMFKNETHNHPTEIEPFGGAATCLGGAIRDPLSGRSYVYQAMRVTGCADPRTPVSETLPGKLPQRKITLESARGYSSYGNQIGLSTGQVHEIYHPNYVAKRLEIGAVVGAAPRKNVLRGNPEPGNVIILVGGRTGRDGIGGATGSSKQHTHDALDNSAEVQKGNPPTERKLQRLFRNEAVSKMIIRCNDFGAGGVSVAIGELADSLEINLDKVPKKYEGLNGTEIAISESQERMAVVVDKRDVEAFIAYADEENLTAVEVAEVTDTGRLRMHWREKTIVDLSRNFLNSNGAPQRAKAFITNPSSENPTEYKIKLSNIEETWMANLRDLNRCSQKGLIERFDSTIGASTVLHPFGGLYKATEPEAMASKIPLIKGETDNATLMSFGYNPFLSEWSPFHGAVYAVVESVARIVASGGSVGDIRLTLQEYFEKLRDDPKRWGKPLAALLGAFWAQMELEIAAIGGKDSMSGSFNELDVPPTLVSFALCPVLASQIISPEFKQAGHQVQLLRIKKDDQGLPIWSDLKEKYASLTQHIRKGHVFAAHSVRSGGIAEAISKMTMGNRIGFEFNNAINIEDLFSQDYGAIIIENNEPLTSTTSIGLTSEKPFVKINEHLISIQEIQKNWEEPLESVFTTLTEADKGQPLPYPEYAKGPFIKRSGKAVKPRVFIPTFPGTNCEYDSAKAFNNAGADTHIFVFRNQSSSAVEASIAEMVRQIEQSQILMIPGGFSSGDEPDGSGKFIAAVFRNQAVKEATLRLIKERDGLILGICNGFQALIKLGLVPFGDIRDADENSPTLVHNDIGRHVSCYVQTRVASKQSPWFLKAELGSVHSIPVSHGEGKFFAKPDVLKSLLDRGQIATQYVDHQGMPSMDIRYNPNGSIAAIEGITSPCGRVLGKMGHSERIGTHVGKNIWGNKVEPIFASGVAYFQE